MVNEEDSEYLIKEEDRKDVVREEEDSEEGMRA